MWISERYIRTWDQDKLSEVVNRCLEIPNELMLNLASKLALNGTVVPKTKKLIEFTKRRLDIDNTTNATNEVVITQELLDNLKESHLLQLEEFQHLPGTEIPSNAIHMDVDVDDGEWNLVQNWQKCPIGSLPGEFGVPEMNLDPKYDEHQYLVDNDLLRYPGDVQLAFNDQTPKITNSFPVRIF